MTGARKPRLTEPVVVEDEPQVNPEVTENDLNDNPEVEPEAPKPTPPPEKEHEPDVQGDAADDPADPGYPTEDQPWFPGRPCLNCGSRDYKWTVGWGATCSECSPETVAAREAAE